MPGGSVTVLEAVVVWRVDGGRRGDEDGEDRGGLSECRQDV